MDERAAVLKVEIEFYQSNNFETATSETAGSPLCTPQRKRWSRQTARRTPTQVYSTTTCACIYFVLASGRRRWSRTYSEYDRADDRDTSSTAAAASKSPQLAVTSELSHSQADDQHVRVACAARASSVLLLLHHLRQAGRPRRRRQLSAQLLAVATNRGVRNAACRHDSAH